ncbi:MAG: 7-cyano-7-deazaguanine synthase QueC [Phycisphaeraceae bacterium]|nr:7-cyano-7-deazaguanine synthase QueC [Phycisphaeraceae bacterium]
MAERAVVLLSGGMDSAVVLAEMRHRGFGCVALSFDYGQRHRAELHAARLVAEALGAEEHRIACIDLRAFGGSALTSDIPVPKDRLGSAEEVPITYVPARNTIFLAHALALAEVCGARNLGIGVNAIDYSGYPDCRPEFIEAFRTLANLATREGVDAAARGEPWLRIHAPLLAMTKGDVVRRGLELGVDFGLTFSCYDPKPTPGARLGVVACGHCDACLLRARGFAEARKIDPGFA